MGGFLNLHIRNPLIKSGNLAKNRRFAFFVKGKLASELMCQLLFIPSSTRFITEKGKYLSKCIVCSTAGFLLEFRFRKVYISAVRVFDYAVACSTGLYKYDKYLNRINRISDHKLYQPE